MKSEQDFLAGIWRTVEILEKEEQQKIRARQRNRLLLKKNICLYTALIFTFMLLIPFGSWNPSFILAICGVYLLLGYLVDSFSFKSINKYRGERL